MKFGFARSRSPQEVQDAFRRIETERTLPDTTIKAPVRKGYAARPKRAAESESEEAPAPEAKADESDNEADSER